MMKTEDFYHQLSRRDLQILCKKYGLPANKSHSEMANMLISHIPNKYTPGETSCSRMTFQNNINGHGDGVNRKGPKRLKPSNDIGNPASGSRFQSQHRDTSGCLRTQENSFSLNVKSPKKGPFSSFEFHVRSDEGINLCVDLNSSPSEWASKLNSECTNLYSYEDHCLQQSAHTGESTKQIVDLGIKDGNLSKDKFQQSWPPPTTVARETILVDFSPSKGTDDFLRPQVVMPCNMAADVSKHLGDKTPVSFIPDSNGQNHVGKFASNSAVESFSSGPICKISSEHQNSYQNPEAYRSNNFLGNSNIVVPGSSTSSSMKVQSSEDATYNQDSERLDKPGLAESKELISGSYHLYSAEKRVKTKSTNGKESSESSQHTLSDDYIHSRSDSVESNGVCSRKKQHMELPNGNNKPDGNSSRSTKNQSGEIVPRRSMRLFPKVTL